MSSIRVPHAGFSKPGRLPVDVSRPGYMTQSSRDCLSIALRYITADEWADLARQINILSRKHGAGPLEFWILVGTMGICCCPLIYKACQTNEKVNAELANLPITRTLMARGIIMYASTRAGASASTRARACAVIKTVAAAATTAPTTTRATSPPPPPQVLGAKDEVRRRRADAHLLREHAAGGRGAYVAADLIATARGAGWPRPRRCVHRADTEWRPDAGHRTRWEQGRRHDRRARAAVVRDVGSNSWPCAQSRRPSDGINCLEHC